MFLYFSLPVGKYFPDFVSSKGVGREASSSAWKAIVQSNRDAGSVEELFVGASVSAAGGNGAA
jgi:hypothetical protein